MTSTYDKWLSERMILPESRGIDVEPGDLGAHLFPHQRAIVAWALGRGRAAVFADTGLGKTAMQVEWADRVAGDDGRVIILAPLAVAEQTVREAERFGVCAEYAREDTGARITVTNYEMLSAFDSSAFIGVVIDESSILKSYTGATRTAITEAFSATPFRLACTATPAPNDHMELGTHSEFLGYKSRVEMLSEYFVHDGGSTQSWRLKGHAVDSFWRWVCSWACMIKRPSDLGFEDGGYELPPLTMHDEVIGVEHRDAWGEGMLFAPPAATLADQRATRRMTRAERVRRAAELADGDEPVLIWCELNAEGDEIERAIDGAVQVSGSDDRDTKRDRLLGFADGRYRVLVTKPKIAGFGMNWQHCSKVVFVGASHSYEQTYQAIRRCWRFGQERPVDVYIIRAETEEAIQRNYERKASDADKMAESMLEHARTAMSSAVDARWNPYNPVKEMHVPTWVGVE